MTQPTGLAPAATAADGVDPFALPSSGPVSRRPRLLSHLGRWGRARRWLPPEALRVLDVGCASGYGAAAIAARGPDGRVIIGLERDPEHLASGRRRFPWLTILEADATALPVPSASADAVLLLDVIEHLADPARALAEARRVLRAGGVLVISVPHRGPLRALDALNVYRSLRRRRPSWPPLEPATESASGEHLHFTRQALAGLLEPSFVIDRTARTGLGLQELVHLLLLMIRGPLRAPGLCRALLPLYLLAYLLDDLLPTGPLAYHLAVRARVAAPAAGSPGEPT